MKISALEPRCHLIPQKKTVWKERLSKTIPETLLVFLSGRRSHFILHTAPLTNQTVPEKFKPYARSVGFYPQLTRCSRTGKTRKTKCPAEHVMCRSEARKQARKKKHPGDHDLFVCLLGQMTPRCSLDRYWSTFSPATTTKPNRGQKAVANLCPILIPCSLLRD